MLCHPNQRCKNHSLIDRFRGENLESLMRTSIVQRLGDGVEDGTTFHGFPSPILASVLCATTFPREPSKLSTSEDIHNFIRHILPNFMHETLCIGLGKGDNGLDSFRAETDPMRALQMEIFRIRYNVSGSKGTFHERALQLELYRTTIQSLPPNTPCSSDVDYQFGSKGFIDFYVSDRQWAIELLRNNNRLESHIHPQYEVYSDIAVKSYVMLNFVELKSGTPYRVFL